MQTKICTRCGNEYPKTTEFFYYVGRAKYGDALRPDCKACKNAASNRVKPESQPVLSRVCPGCNVEYPNTTEYFYTRVGGKTRRTCKSCDKKTNAQHNARRAPKEKKAPATKVVKPQKVSPWRNDSDPAKERSTPQGRILKPKNDSDDAIAVKQVLDAVENSDPDAPLVARVWQLIQERDEAKRKSLRLIVENSHLRMKVK